MTTVRQQISKPLLRDLQRQWLDLWGAIGIAPGWRYAAFEKFGERLSSRYIRRAVLPNHCSLCCDLRDHVQRQIYFLGTYEPLEAYLFSQLVKPGMTVVDAGANIGQYTLLAATILGARGTVHSFEPIPNTFLQLSENVRANTLFNVHLNQAGLWQKSMPIRLGLASDMAQNCGAYSVGVRDQETAVDAIAVALDDYAEQRNIQRIDFIKMDIEGAEHAALLGMQKIINRDHPVFLMELNPVALERLGYNTKDLWHLMVETFGYTVYRVDSEACVPIQSLAGIPQSNLIFVHPSNPVDAIRTEWNFKQVLRWSRRCKRSL